MDGWAKLGQGLGALFNKDAGEEAYRARLAENATINQRMAQAALAQQKNLARESILSDGSLDDLQKAILLGELGSDYSSLMQGRLRDQEFGFRGDAVDAARQGDWGLANAFLAGTSRGPVAVNQALAGGRMQGNVFDPNAELRLTDIGRAVVGREQSAAQANLARAGASNAMAGLYTARTERPEDFRSPPRPASSQQRGAFYTPREVLEIVEYNRQASRRGSGLTPIPVPKPGDPKPTMSGVSEIAQAFTGGSPQQPPASGSEKPKRFPGSPYDEGTILEGPNSQLFVVENGVPVPVL